MADLRDYTSIYGIKEMILNDIAPKYFDVDDISLLNVGLFGMITDISGTTIEDNFRTTARYVTELLPGRSRLPEFIYANAANYGITDIFSTCATCPAIIFIKEDDVLTYGKTKTNSTSREYTIDADLSVYIEDVPYSIPYNIVIRSSEYKGVWHHHCTYDMSMTNTVAKGIKYPYIKSVKTKVVGENATYLALTVTLYQYRRRRITENIVTNTKLNIPYIELEFEDSLCNFEVFYTSATKNHVQLLKYLETVPASIKPFTYYKLTDENVLRLSFTNDDRYFVPEYDSQLEILIYESIGKKGNFPLYTGTDVYISGNSENAELDYNNEVPLYCLINGDSSNGEDAYTLDELRILTWESQRTINSYTTDEDLNQYFLTYAKIYDSEALFIKTRDDFVSRIYSCFTRLMEGVNIFPTNTLDLELDFNKIGGWYPKATRYIIPPGTRIGYKEGSSDVGVILADDEEAEIVYTTIGLISINKHPTNVGYYMTSIDKNIEVDYLTTNNDSAFQFIVKQFNLSRNAVQGETSYDVSVMLIPSDLSAMETSVPLNPSTETPEGLEPEEPDPNELNANLISVYLMFETNVGHYIKLELDVEKSSKEIGFTFTGKLDTNDLISGDTIELTNLTSCLSQDVQVCSVDMQNTKMKILTFYNEGIMKASEFTELIPEAAGLTLTNTFAPVENEMYLAYPLSLMKSEASFVEDKSELGFHMNITRVPLFSRDFLLDDVNMKSALSRLNSQHTFLLNALKQITSNFAVVLQFFNTYGRSRIFTVTDGSLLNRTNCDIAFDIKFADNVNIEEYMTPIKITIKNYIESLNDSNTTGVNRINISELITLLHNTYEDQIDYIIFKSINGYDSSIQNIIMTQDLTSSKNIGAVPEFLTINTENILITPL